MICFMRRSTTKSSGAPPGFGPSRFVERQNRRPLYSECRRRTVESDTCISEIKRCRTLEALNSVHASMLRTHLHLNLFFFTNLISQYASMGYMVHASVLFSACESETPDVFLWNIMIQGFAHNGPCCHRSIVLYRQMRDLGVVPDNFTFPSTLKACAHLRDVEAGEAIHGDVVKFGYDSNDVFVANSLVAMYGKCGQPHVSRQLFEQMRERNVVSWNSLIGSYAQSGFYDDGLSLFSRMLDEGIRPNRSTILNVMPCVHQEDDANGICQVIIDSELGLDQAVQSAVVGMYSRCGRIEIARRFFDVICDKDLLSWSSMIEAYVRADLPICALELFKEMLLLGTRPDSVTLLGVVRACSNLASLHQARFVHGFVIRRSLKHEIILETALVDLYVKCGSLDYARRIFDRLEGRNLISWSTMISGYGMHGHGREAIHLFGQMMKDSVKPDHVTFVSVLSACSHAGLTDEGWRCFNSMSKAFGIVPRSEHYACMVDLLGRAGQLDEALEFIKDMPIKPDSGVWGSLLGACRIHSNAELAEVAAGYLFELDVDNPGRYVLLANIYASTGKREEADRIRNLMRYRRVRKIAGHTIIEVKNRVYKFVTGDQSNPEMEIIYEELGRLMERIKQEGYQPDTNFVFHDVEEETKETLLYCHSEKLAIVFGLLNSNPESVIRIRKNLRICGDCHVATKFISEVTRREIVARDAHRFHHFKGGACSCGDYW